jgi:ubiquinone/menaquinone biosynthesis C-methylase UbiE
MNKNDTTTDEVYKASVRHEWMLAAPGWERWFDTTEATDAGAAITDLLLQQAALEPGDHVLDAGSGYGEPGLSAAAIVGDAGSVTCLDISGDMLAFAERRARAAGLANVRFLEADIEYHPLEPGAYDAIVSRAVLMYTADPLATLGRLRDALKPQGRLAAAVWATPDRVAFSLPLGVMIDRGLIDPPPPGPGVFALGADGVLEHLLHRAGFVDVRAGTAVATYTMPTAEDCTRWFRDVVPPITELITSHPAEVQEAVWTRVTTAWASYQDDSGRVALPCTAVWAAGARGA